jgi:hypothetical protein
MASNLLPVMATNEQRIPVGESAHGIVTLRNKVAVQTPTTASSFEVDAETRLALREFERLRRFRRAFLAFSSHIVH